MLVVSVSKLEYLVYMCRSYWVKQFDWCAFIVWNILIGVPLLCERVWLVCVPLLCETLWLVCHFLCETVWLVCHFLCETVWLVCLFLWNSLIGVFMFCYTFFFSIKCHYKSPVVEMYVSFVCHLVITVQLIFTHCAVTFAPEHLMKVVCYMLLYINVTWNNNAEDLMSTFNWVHPVQCDSLRCPASQASKCKLRNDVCLNFFGFSTCATISSSKELCISFLSLSFNIVYCPIIQAILYSKKSGQNYLHLFM